VILIVKLGLIIPLHFTSTPLKAESSTRVLGLIITQVKKFPQVTSGSWMIDVASFTHCRTVHLGHGQCSRDLLNLKNGSYLRSHVQGIWAAWPGGVTYCRFTYYYCVNVGGAMHVHFLNPCLPSSMSELIRYCPVLY
jgi:hypothetical protein